MNEEENIDNKILAQNKALELLNLIYILKLALKNNEDESPDTMPYAAFVGMLENKAKKLFDILEC